MQTSKPRCSTLLDASFNQACPVQEQCGGCPLLPLDRSSELKTKLDSVSTSLSEVGVSAEVLAMPETQRFGYRNRLRMKVVDGRVEFFNKAKHDGCLVVSPILWAAIVHVLAVSASRPSLLADVAHIEVRVGDDNRLGLVTSIPVDEESLQQELGDDWVVGSRGSDTSPALSYQPASGVEIAVPITSFVQVNSAVNRQLVQVVLDVAELSRAQTFLDLYCGAGNFSIPLAERGLTGTAVENVGAAVAQLGRTIPARNGAIRCIEGDARTLLSELEPADLVIADPPRAGLMESHRQVANLVGDTLFLVGCKTSSFARDVAALSSDGLELESVRVFDMFPGTVHVEALAVFRNRPDCDSSTPH